MKAPIKSILEEKKLFIFDMDGVIYRMNKPITEAIEFIKLLRKKSKKIAFFTNNSSKSPKMFQTKLRKLGLNVSLHEIFTSATITAANLKKRMPEALVYTVGEKGLNDVLQQHGFTILNRIDPTIENIKYLKEDQTADLVIVGWDTKVTYAKLRTALMLILKGALFLATNDDPTYPVPGTLWPGSGANVAFLERALGTSPQIIFGKPYPEGFITILKQYQIPAQDAVMIGDRLETDIFGANQMKITTIAVETGIHSQKDLKNYAKAYHPDYFLTNLKEMLG